MEGNVIIVTGLVTIQRTAEISIVIKELDEMVINLEDAGVKATVEIIIIVIIITNINDRILDLDHKIQIIITKGMVVEAEVLHMKREEDINAMIGMKKMIGTLEETNTKNTKDMNLATVMNET